MSPLWPVVAILAGVFIGRALARAFDADQREVGADEAFDTLPDWARESTPIHDELLAERSDWALWEIEYLRRGADQ